MLFPCVRYFDFASFNMNFDKELMKKYHFRMHFQNAYEVLVVQINQINRD